MEIQTRLGSYSASTPAQIVAVDRELMSEELEYHHLEEYPKTREEFFLLGALDQWDYVEVKRGEQIEGTIINWEKVHWVDSMKLAVLDRNYGAFYSEEGMVVETKDSMGDVWALCEVDGKLYRILK